MAKFVWIQASNPAKKYLTLIPNDPNVPAGYVLTNTRDGSWQGADGINDVNAQKYVGGVNSGGYPIYAGDPATASSKWPNGHLGGD